MRGDQSTDSTVRPGKLCLLGSPEFAGETQRVRFAAELRFQLVAYLAFSGEWVRRGALAGLFYGALGEEAARRNLRKLLLRTRDFDWINGSLQANRDGVRLQMATDVQVLLAAAREQRPRAVIELYRGPLLHGLEAPRNTAFNDWLDDERERLRSLWRDAVFALAAGDVAPAESIELTDRLLASDPLDEPALRVHLAALHRCGETAQARRVHRDFSERLADELGIEPGAETRRLLESFAGIKPTASTPPAIANSFIGRSAELRQISALLAQGDCRVLTIVGPGGVGKSRLAQRALEVLASGFAGGAFFVALEDVSAPADVGARLARALGLQLVSGAAPFEQVVEFLRERQVLLVLDNLEHLIACAGLIDVLVRTCAQLRLIVTSRARLATANEWLLPLEGLPYPMPEDDDRADAFDAVRLFMQVAERLNSRASALAGRAAIADICRQVEGLPLAVEIAAAWSRLLPCDAIADDLRRGAELLRTADPARPARQAGMQAAFEHSWRLLAPVERETLARFSVFRGGFSRHAARAVAGASLPVLAALADKSLVRSDAGRFSLHPLLCQFAAGKLLESAAAAVAAKAHAQWYQHWFERTRSAADHGERATLDDIERELENGRAAWRWAVENSDATLLAGIAPALARFFELRGRAAEGCDLLEQAAACIGADAPVDPGCACAVLWPIAQLQYRLDRYDDAEATARRALKLARTARRKDTQIYCLNVLGLCRWQRGRYREARRLFEEELRRARSNADPRSVAIALGNLALVEQSLGNYGPARQLLLAALAQQRGLGDQLGVAIRLNNLGNLHQGQRDWVPAREYLSESLGLCERHGLALLRPHVLNNLALIAFETGDFDAAEELGQQALAAARQTANRHIASMTLLHFVRLALHRADCAGARAHLRAALVDSLATGNERLQLDCAGLFGEVLAAQGELRAAARIWSFVAQHAKVGAADRAELEARLAAIPSDIASAVAPLPVDLDELLRRIVAETEVAHAPLIALLSVTR